MQNPTPSDAPHFVVGGCTHTATLEPHKLDEEYAVKPNSIDGNSSRTNAYKAVFEEMQKNEPDKRWLTKSDYETCMRMADSAREHPLLQTYLHDPDTIIEGTGYFGYEGAECQIRPDLFNTRSGVVIDLKTTQEGDPKGFGYSVRKYGYDFQTAFYMEGLRRMGYNPTQFIYLCVEKSAPYLTSAYEIDLTQVSRMKVKMGEACKTWVKCMESGVWPGYGDHVQTLSFGRKTADSNRLSIKELTEYFNVSRSFVYNKIRDFDLKTEVYGRRRTVDMSEFANTLNPKEDKK
jgi:exodeoxyribonuclease VIII